MYASSVPFETRRASIRPSGFLTQYTVAFHRGVERSEMASRRGKIYITKSDLCRTPVTGGSTFGMMSP